MRIFVASDLSAASDEAVRQGLAMAQPGDALALLHVMPELSTHAFLAQDNERDIEAQLALQPRLADALRAQVERLVPGVPAQPEILIEQGSDYGEIVRRAEEWHADLVVVGSHGRKGLTRFILGSVAERVVRFASCPVLVVRPSAPGVVLVATDLSDPSMPAIEAGAREAKRRDRKLVVMHAMSIPGEGDAAMGLLGALPAVEPPDVRASRRGLAEQIIQSALERFGASGDVVVVEDDATEQVLSLAKSLPAELIVVGTKGRSGLARVLLGSVATHVVQGAPCSVLAVRHVRSSSSA